MAIQECENCKYYKGCDAYYHALFKIGEDSDDHVYRMEECKGFEPAIGNTHNMSNWHPSDEFICANCGIHLTNYESIETDIDDGYEVHCEYCFKFCPECGAKVDD